MQKSNGKRSKESGRLFLYPLTPEDALQRALSMPPLRPPEKPPTRSKAKIKQRKKKTG